MTVNLNVLKTTFHKFYIVYIFFQNAYTGRESKKAERGKTV